MNALRWSAVACAITTVTVIAAGCAATGGGYGDTVYYGADYYEPYGYDYGGWGAGYGVAPYRDGGYRGGGDHGGGRGGTHAYHAAPASHSMPSIPSGSRSSGRSR
ncbi:MAG TPA: hypothetical protein VKS60_12015 [Stellaceae bacterium]|nr:hypothetical protein [Stellaceae bacterium]